MMIKKTLEICIEHYRTIGEVAMLEDYLDTMSRDEKGKTELLDAIDSYDIPILYYTLFEDFAGLLTEEEFFYYMQKGIETCDDAHLAGIIRKAVEDTVERKREELERKYDDSNCLDEDNTTFTVSNDKGEQVECEVLFTFEHEVTRKTYIVYTDNTYDSDGNTKIYASILSDVDNMRLLPIETEEEWAVIESILEELNKD